MWGVEQQEAAKGARTAAIRAENERLASARMPVDYAERIARATRHCVGDYKAFGAPPRELYIEDCSGERVRDEVDLENLVISSEWVSEIVSGIFAATVAQQKVNGKVSSTTTRLRLAGTNVTDSDFYPVHKLKQLTFVDVSRCSALTDDSLSLLRRHLSNLQELHITECRHFTSDVLCQVWKDCTKLHTLVARGCPGVTDALLQCIATTKRTSCDATLRVLDIRHCKHVTSSGISHIATSTIKDVRMHSLSVADCLEVDNMAFFGFETSLGLTSLVSLELSGLQLDETGISWIAKGCCSLESLNLSRCRAVNDFSLLLLSPLVSARLKYLNLKECALLSDQGIRNLFASEEAKRETAATEGRDDDDPLPGVLLEVLNLKNCLLVGDESAHVLGSHCANLLTLNLRGLRKVSDTGILSIVKGCAALAAIKLSGRRITVNAFKILGKICPKLQALDISERSDLDSPACCINLTSGISSSNLMKINFCSTNICDIGVSVIALNCHNLAWINLSKCLKITDAAVEALAYCCRKLEVLLLQNTKAITDRGLVACAMMRPPLHIVDLGGNTNITDGGIQALCATCQHIQELRLKGCDRLSFQAIKKCNNMLPYTKIPPPESLSQKLATGGVNKTMLAALPERHRRFLRFLAKQYESACVLQAKFRRWKEKEASTLFLARRRFQRETRAARKIQRCAKSFLSWRRYLRHLMLERNMPKVVFVQAHVRGRQSRHHTRVHRFTATRAAKCIQRGFRPHHVVRMRFRSVYALDIQRVYRGFLGRKEFKQALGEKRRECARRIWKWYRRCLHQRDFQERSQWLIRKVHNIQGQWRKYKRRQNLTRYLGYYRTHVTNIQKMWRGFAARQYVCELRVDMTRAAVHFQRLFRGHRARKAVCSYRQLVTSMVVIIQKNWRRFCDQRIYRHKRRVLIRVQRMARYALTVRHLRRIVESAMRKHRHEAALCIQRQLRGHYGRRRALLFRKIRNARLVRKGQNATQALIRRRFIQHGAALRIQKWIRRVQARLKMLKVRKWRRFVAARCIQRYLREWIRHLRLRRKRESQLHATANIQRVYRGHLGRVAFKAERHRQDCLGGAKLIQRVYRGFLARRFYAKEKREMNRAARMLQRAFRGRQARKFYEISQAVAALKAKEKYDKSFLGMLDAKRNPMDELYRRAKLPHEKEVLQKLKQKWEANRLVEERAVRKQRREFNNTWAAASETIANHASVRRKLYGVTENVYVSHREYVERQEHHAALKSELIDLHMRVFQCKQALRTAVSSRRMLDGKEIMEILNAHKLLMDVGDPVRRHNNQAE